MNTRSIRLTWNGEKWQAEFGTGEIVSCPDRDTLRKFLDEVERRAETLADLEPGGYVSDDDLRKARVMR